MKDLDRWEGRERARIKKTVRNSHVWVVLFHIGVFIYLFVHPLINGLPENPYNYDIFVTVLNVNYVYFLAVLLRYNCKATNHTLWKYIIGYILTDVCNSTINIANRVITPWSFQIGNGGVEHRDIHSNSQCSLLWHEHRFHVFIIIEGASPHWGHLSA